MKVLRRKSDDTSPIESLKREMDRFFDDLAPFSWRRGDGGSLADTWAPETDLSATDDEYVIQLDLPGLDKKDLKVNYQDGRLTISGERKSEEKEEKKDYIRRERFHGSFFRSVTLPEPVKEEDIKASFKNGVLTVRVPRAEVPKAKSVKIE